MADRTQLSWVGQSLPRPCTAQPVPSTQALRRQQPQQYNSVIGHIWFLRQEGEPEWRVPVTILSRQTPACTQTVEVPVPQSGVGGFPRPRHHGSESLFPARHTTATRTQHGLAPVAGDLLRKAGRAGGKPCPAKMQREPLTAPGTSAPAAVPHAGTAPGHPATSWTRPRSHRSRHWALPTY